MKKTMSVPVVILRTRTGFSAFSPLIEGCVAADKTIDKTLQRMREALEFHLEGLQLLKQKKHNQADRALKDTFKDYGTDAFYASLKIAA